jgi:hypothetical protein
MREPTNARTRRARAGRNQLLLAYSMWVVLGGGLIVLGVLVGLAYVRETTEDDSDAPEVVAEKPRVDPLPKSENKPEPKLEPKPKLESKPRSKRKLKPKSKRKLKPKPKPETKPKLPKPKISEPATLKEAGGSSKEQQEMLDRSGAVADRSEKMVESGALADEDFENVEKIAQRGRTILASRNAANDEKRWVAVLRYTREKNANSGEHERYLDDVERRQRAAARKVAEAAKAAAREEAERKAAMPPPAVQVIHDLLSDAAKAQDASRSSKSRSRVSAALNKTLEKAWGLTSRLKGSDRGHQAGLRIFIHNSRGACQEVLAELARHRRKQDVMKIRARTQGVAVLAYEKTLKMGGDAVYSTGISARAWALHRIAVLSQKIAKHHTEKKASYEKERMTYPRANLIGNFRNKSHDAIARLKADYPKAKDQSGRLLSSIVK